MFADPTFWVAVAFVIFFGLVFWKGLKPMLAGLDARAERIRKQIDEAESLREEAQKTLSDYKRKHREALKEAEIIVEHAKTEAERVKEQTEKDLEAALKRREESAMEKLSQAEAAAVREVRVQAVEVAVAATRRLLRAGLDENRSKAMIEEAIKDVEARFH